MSTKRPTASWHPFDIALDKAEELIRDGLVQPREQVFQAPGGATTKKVIYNFYYHYAYLLGECEEEPRLIAAHIEDKNGHILPYVRFEGGRVVLRSGGLDALREAAARLGTREHVVLCQEVAENGASERRIAQEGPVLDPAMGGGGDGGLRPARWGY